MRREEILLTESIQRTLDEAHRAVIKLHEAQESSTLDSIDDDHEQSDAQELLSYYVEKAFRDTGILSERLGLPIYAGEINAERLANRPDFSENEYTDHDVLPHVPHLARVRSHFESLRSMTDVASTTAHDVLKTMLLNTGRLIEQRGFNPESESMVRNVILESLQLAFDDVRKEVQIQKSLKTYRGDIGVPGLRAVVEYKYVKTKDAMKSCLDGIYADMKGYGQDDAWRNFYAVFYMTGPFYRQEEVEKEFALVNADVSWTPLLTQGPGAR
ncbi:hypothetical protein WT77_23180 [Burkholderia stagnalis]|uniref:PD-(D/E)XK nuclease domain-containing protein n=1 Tax=Burkholderia stagnalis TaxID=1503054 RepID=UPI00075F8862|nr:hypothetical protein [Burkholderia stagnalis]KWK20694.1 hypothetical protein WT77_23180 [Burkholderia stagnalis]